MAPPAVKVVPEPRQTLVLDGVMVIVKVGETLTVATACAVQAPVPAKTVYVVVVVGVTVTVPDGDGDAPVLAVQTNGPVLPETLRLVVCPLQIIVPEGVMFTDNEGVIETVATACAVQAPVPERTV